LHTSFWRRTFSSNRFFLDRLGCGDRLEQGRPATGFDFVDQGTHSRFLLIQGELWL
jgi:hypothetical protein